eukprot:c26664_g1_i1 orf=93-1241(+)
MDPYQRMDKSRLEMPVNDSDVRISTQGKMRNHVTYATTVMQARSISSVNGDAQYTRFLVGTLSAREENEVHLIRFSSNSGEVTCDGLYPHHHEIWNLASCPFDYLIFSTVFASGSEYGASLWKMPEHEKGSSHLLQLAELHGHTNKIKCTLWWPSGRHNQLASIDEEALFLWSLDASGKSVKMQAQLSAGMLHHMAGGAWDPHDINIVATACESSIQHWDLRSMKQIQTLEHAHVRDIDFNPKKQHIFVTAGDDSKIHIWDQRMPGMFLLEVPGHSHWTWQARYNPKYAELLLSCGTDSAVNLWQVEPFEGLEYGKKSPDDSPRAQLDPLIQSYNGHEDSVYGIAWSSREPWIFASLSYDGRVVIESVPQPISKMMKPLTGE